MDHLDKSLVVERMGAMFLLLLIVAMITSACGGSLLAFAKDVTGGEDASSGDNLVTAASVASGELDAGAASGPGDTGVEPVCGNGVVEVGESCDEQGPMATCDEDCTPVDCGDGLINEVAGEECDEGGATETCNLDCTLPRCGDGQINVEGEECDDAVASAFCDVDCTVAECGDGVLNTLADEECDDAGRTETCNDNCRLPECGDGMVNEATGEACDDAGASAECDEDCTMVECGDGVFNALAGELCEIHELAGATCEGLGLGAGALECDGGCQGYETSGCPPAMPVLSLGFSQVKQFDFSWAAVQGAEYYQVLESPALGEPYGQLGGDVVGESVSFEMPLHFRLGASYLLQACNGAGCADSAVVNVVGPLAEAVGYLKASNASAGDLFGIGTALSQDGNTLAIGAYEDSAATGIGGDPADNAAPNAGAVYIFGRNEVGTWSQQAYLKASNTEVDDHFGYRVALSQDGNTLAVGAPGEGSNATGIGGNQADNTAEDAGAVYVFVRDGAGAWSQQAYVKASNTDASDFFGISVALSESGSTLAVGASGEESAAVGIGGNSADNTSWASGAVYVFVRNGAGSWSQQAYVKASNTGEGDEFGYHVALSGSGNTLAVGAGGEDSNATGIGGNQANNSAIFSGAVYVLVRDGAGAWSQQAYVKGSNTESFDHFGGSVALSADGNTLAVGSYGEDSNATGIGGNQADESADSAGAVYLFVRDGGGTWSQQAYIKSSNTGAHEWFGYSVALSGDGNTLAVGSYEDSSAIGVGGNQADESAVSSGAVYLLVHSVAGGWSQQAYVKAPNTEASDQFGYSVALSGEGNTLAIGALHEDSNAMGIEGNQADNSASNSGAVYLY